MANLLQALRNTGTDVLGTVSATTGTVTHLAEAASYLAETGTIHAKAYRDDSIAEINENSVKRQLLRINAAKIEVSRNIRDLQRELQEDAELAEIFYSLDDELFVAPSSSK